MNRKPKTMTQVLTRSLVKGLVAFSLVAIGFVFLANAANTQPTHDVYGGQDYPHQIAAQHNCWTGGENNPVPTAAVVTFRGEVTARYTEKSSEVKAALEFALGEDRPRVYSVTAFCTK